MFLPEIKSQPNEDICILFRLDNHSPNYIVDCGDASGLGVKECQNAEVVFISHTHIDHFINFDQILRHQIGIERRVVITGPRDIHLQVQAKIRGYSWNLIKPGAIVYEIREIISESEINVYEVEPPVWELKKIKTISSGVVYANDRFEVRFTLLDHKLPTVAYLFKEVDSVKIDLSKGTFRGGAWVRLLKQAFEAGQNEATIEIEGNAYKAEELYHLLEVKRGDSLGVIMDHAASEANHEKIKGLFTACNRVFIECFYKTEEKDMAALNYHSYAQASGKVMQACGVKEAIPVHFSRKYTQADLEQIAAEFYAELS
jgi:ribonuclease Z